MRKKGIDPNIDTMLFHTMSPVECPDMILYKDVYFTQNAFAKQVYLGVNGVFLIIPLVTDDLEADGAEQKRIEKVLEEIYGVLQLQLYVYPVLVGEERSFYMHDMEHLVELEEPEVFLKDLYHYTLDHKLEPSKVPEQYSEIKGYVSGTKKRVSVLDERTLERLIEIITPLEGIERPCDAVRYEADGTKYIQRAIELLEYV